MIEPLEARIAPAVFVVTNLASSGSGSLKQAILDANADGVADTINFNIPGNSIYTLALTEVLPFITGPVTINGYTQNGAAVNTADIGTNAQIRIFIDGSALDGRDGFVIDSSNVTIRGVGVYGFKSFNNDGGRGIEIRNVANTVIEGCFIGVNSTGQGGERLDDDGISVGTGSSNTRIGGPALDDRNLISNSRGAGIFARGTGVTIQGNLIGVAADGITPLPNESHGIGLSVITGAQIGGPNFGEGNVIAYNGFNGVSLFGNVTGANIEKNSIYRNGALGIDLDGDGVTFNDLLDNDAGSNALQNFPVITGVTVVNGTLTKVLFSLNSTPNSEFRIDLYSSGDPDSSGYGEGRESQGSVVVQTDGFGVGSSEFQFLDTFPLGTTFAATATNTLTNNTSEFSKGFNINNLELPNDRTATWVDGDGDKVTLKVTKGTLTPEMFQFGGGGINGGAILRLLQLTDESFQGTSVTLSVKKAGFGDGRVSIGYLDATGVDLANVTIPGDLARIACGNTDGTTLSLAKLKVQSFGAASALTLPDAKASSFIRGPVGSIMIAGDFRDTAIQMFAAANSPEEMARMKVGSISIGGDMVGGTVGTMLSVTGEVKTFTVKGSLISTDQGLAGISISGNVGRISVGSLYNGLVDVGFGNLATEVHGKVAVKGSILDGRVSVGIAVDTITVSGSVIGTRSNSGTVGGSRDLALVSIKGDLIGGASTFAAFVTNAGVIGAGGSIKTVNIGGSVIGGTTTAGATVLNSGVIRAGDALGKVIIGGDTIGSLDSPVVISAVGQDQKPVTGFDVAIQSITIKGNATNTRILAGYDNSLNPANADASIGSVTVAKNWVGSSIAAGVEDSGPDGFGAGDTLQAVGNTGLVARIASISIRGSFLPSLNPEANFGFAAQEIVKATVGGIKASLDAGPSNDGTLQLWAFPNLRLQEV